MSGPWEKYQASEPKAGPWEKYQAPQGDAAQPKGSGLRNFLGGVSDVYENIRDRVGQSVDNSKQGNVDLVQGIYSKAGLEPPPKKQIEKDMETAQQGAVIGMGGLANKAIEAAPGVVSKVGSKIKNVLEDVATAPIGDAAAESAMGIVPNALSKAVRAGEKVGELTDMAGGKVVKFFIPGVKYVAAAGKVAESAPKMIQNGAGLALKVPLSEMISNSDASVVSLSNLLKNVGNKNPTPTIPEETAMQRMANK